MMLTSAISTFPVETISGNTIASNVDNITYTCMNSFSSSVTTFAGQNYGAMKRDRLWKVLIYSTIQVTVIGILIAQLELLFAHPLASLFIESGTEAKEIIIEQAILVMKTILTYYFLCGIYGVLAGFIRGLGNSTGPMITAVSTVLAVRSTWIYVFFPMHGDRIDWLMLCYPITWIITIIMNCIILTFTVKKLKFGTKSAQAELAKS
jgi:Na+-driven multidrug efflux pump